MWHLITKAVQASGSIELAILYLLMVFSVASWAVIFLKVIALRTAQRNNRTLISSFDASDVLVEFVPPVVRGPAPLESIFLAATQAIQKYKGTGDAHLRLPADKLHEQVMLRMRHRSADDLNALKWGSGFLASAGSVSPFIGLFGTVWGIMATFQALGDAKSASLNVVAPGISSALIATAAGLAVAIPAVMAYNWILSRVELLEEQSSAFIERMDFMTRVKYPGDSNPRSVDPGHGPTNGEPTRTATSEPMLTDRT